MAKDIKTNIVLGGKVAASLQKAFNTANNETQQLEKAYQSLKGVGVKAFGAIAVAAAGVATAVIASAEATRDYRKDLAKMYNNAEMAGIANQEAWSGLEELYAMSGEFDSANEAMSNLIATGFKGEKLVDVIEAINGATIKWQDTVTQEALADSLNETIKAGAGATGQFAEIIERSGTNIDTFNDGLIACNGLAERQQYVMDWLAKSGLANVNEAYQEQNKSLVDAYKSDLAYQQSMAELGAVAEPLAALFKGTLAGGISYFADKLEGVDFATVSKAMKEVGRLEKEAFDLIWEALSKIDWASLISAGVTVLGVFTSIFNFVVSNWSAISPLIYGIVGAMVAYKAIMIGANVVTAISTALKVANSFAMARMAGMSLKEAAATAIATAAQNGLNLAFLASPITWIVVGIGLIVAAIVLLYKRSETFREFWGKCWEGIKKGFGVAADFIKSGIEGIMNLINGVGDALESAWDAVTGFFGGKDTKKMSVTVNGKNVASNYLGGTYTSPLLTTVAEYEPETIVPHNNSPRSQALALEAVRGTGLNLGGNKYIYAPVIHANGSNSSEIRGILEDGYERFKAFIEEYERERARVSY